MPPGAPVAGGRALVGLLTTALLALCACAASEETPGTGLDVSLGGRLTVVGPDAEFDPHRPPGDWDLFHSRSGATDFSVAKKEGVLALRLENEGGGSLLGRHIKAPLLAMPYLRWGWHLESPAEQPEGRMLSDLLASKSMPLYLLVGFRGGVSNRQPKTDWRSAGTGTDRLRLERALLLAWSGNPLEPRGLDAAGALPRHVLREGWREAGQWIVETVDLSRLYAQFWPADRIGDVEVVFLAAGAGPTNYRSVGFVAEIVLSK